MVIEESIEDNQSRELQSRFGKSISGRREKPQDQFGAVCLVKRILENLPDLSGVIRIEDYEFNDDWKELIKDAFYYTNTDNINYACLFGIVVAEMLHQTQEVIKQSNKEIDKLLLKVSSSSSSNKVWCVSHCIV